ncbi:MAG: dethiobiotin synthase, partial [Nitrospirae bacterium]|nr:dethiobiotin synthase [Nitrospirota bacterium]
MRGFFITGTDTGVGKTVVSAMLSILMLERGFNVSVRKPIETGCDTQTLIPKDGLFLKQITGSAESLDVITPVRLRSPLAPLVAADLDGTTIDVEALIKSLCGIDSSCVAVVEGVGGLVVPIARQFFVSDLIKALGLPAILVSANRLGTINHTLLSLEHMLNKGITVAGIVFNNNCVADPSYHKPLVYAVEPAFGLN